MATPARNDGGAGGAGACRTTFVLALAAESLPVGAALARVPCASGGDSGSEAGEVDIDGPAGPRAPGDLQACVGTQCMGAIMRYCRAVEQLRPGFRASVLAPVSRGTAGVSWLRVATDASFVGLAQALAAWLSGTGEGGVNALPPASALTPACLAQASDEVQR